MSMATGSGANNSKTKREHDRHDGTGRGHEGPAKHGGGKGNWGAPGSEYQEDVDHEVQRSLEEEAAIDASGPDRISAADLPADDKVMTLDEYEKQQAQKK